MASSKAASSIALLLCLNLVLFTIVSASSCAPSKPKPKPSPKPAPVTPKPSPKPAPVTPKPGPSGSQGSCPKDTLKFGVCADLLKGLLHVIVGTPPDTPCCTLIEGLTDLEAAICLCTAIKAKVLGINVNAPISLTVLLNHCGKKCPKDFQCA